jgi:hypothetical protein
MVHHSKIGLPMAEMGHSRRFTTPKSTSVLPPIATIRRTFRIGSFVPTADVSRCSKNHYSITSSARPSSESGIEMPRVKKLAGYDAG